MLLNSTKFAKKLMEYVNKKEKETNIAKRGKKKV